MSAPAVTRDARWRFFAGPNSVGILAALEIPEPFGPRNRIQSGSAATIVVTSEISATTTADAVRRADRERMPRSIRRLVARIHDTRRCSSATASKNVTCHRTCPRARDYARRERTVVIHRVRSPARSTRAARSTGFIVTATAITPIAAVTITSVIESYRPNAKEKCPDRSRPAQINAKPIAIPNAIWRAVSVMTRRAKLAAPGPKHGANAQFARARRADIVSANTYAPSSVRSTATPANEPQDSYTKLLCRELTRNTSRNVSACIDTAGSIERKIAATSRRTVLTSDLARGTSVRLFLTAVWASSK